MFKSIIKKIDLKNIVINCNNQMGIQHLNKLLKFRCNDAISKIPLSNLRKKKIVIDTSIYLYKFAGEVGIIEGMYQMITILLKNNIIPVFIFDGKPPKEKEELLKKRKEEKYIAKEKSVLIKKKIELMQENDIYANTSLLEEELNELKKQCIKITWKDIHKVKELMKLMGVTYFHAEGEADELCAKLVLKKYAWAVLSEDMDMFVYGCPRILRYLSLLTCTVVMYDYRHILKILKMTQTQFKEICILSGTDYNITCNPKVSLVNTLKYFEKYKKREKNKSFYEWMNENTNYIDDYYHLSSTYVMFDIQNINTIKYEKQKIMNGPINKELLNTFLEKFGFIFIQN